MRRVRVVCFYVRSSEGCSPRLCRFKTVLVETKEPSIDYVLAHMGIMGPHKLSSFNSRRVGRYPTLPIGCRSGLCVGHPWMLVEVSHGRHAVG
jgi:hypothetical protein